MKTKKITLFLMANIICLYSFSLAAKDIFANATSGLDTNDGLTPETSVQTVAQAYTLATDGDVIKLEGTFLFESQIVLVKSLTIQSAASTKAVLDGQTITRFFELHSDITFNNLKFQNGSASDGAVMFIPIGFWRVMNINDCIFDNNIATGQGGVFRMITYGGNDLLKINRCLFVNNESGSHGGVFSYIPEGGNPENNSAVLTISNTTFTGNKNNGGIGGILFADGGATQWATFNFNNITVSGNSDFGNVTGNLPGFAFMKGATTVNVKNSIIEGNPSSNGDYADFSFDSTPTALTINNSIIGHVTIYGATVPLDNFVATESNVNNVKISTDALVAGLGTFNGTYFPLTSESLAYNFGRMSNLTSATNADQLGITRTNTDLTSAGAVEFYNDITQQVTNQAINSTLLVGKNQITINAENVKVKIYNVTGALVHDSMVNGSEIVKLLPGIYVVKLSSDLSKATTKVIIK